MNTSHWHFQILLLVSLLLSGCGQNSSDKTGNIPMIDIVGNLGKYQAIPVSRYITELEYIPLETDYNFLVAEEDLDLIVTSTHIFVRGNRYCYAFSRDGRFLSRIGSLGQGPGEYSFLSSFSMDEKNQSLYLKTLHSLLEYSWDGVLRQSIDLPKDKHGTTLNDIFFVRDNLFIGHSTNYRGDLLHNFILFDQSSEVVKSFDNYMQFNRTREMISSTDRSMKPYRIGKCIYVKEFTNDTLFYLNEQNELIPQFIFDLGEYTITKEKREKQAIEKTAFEDGGIIIPMSSYLPSMIGLQNHIFFVFSTYSLSGKFRFPKEGIRRPVAIPPGMQTTGRTTANRLFGIYDIANQTTLLLDTDPISRIRGLVNDLDGGLYFWPRYYTSENELVDIWQVEDMKEFLTEDYFAEHEIKDPAAHQKLKELVQKLDEEDNPVVVIGKLRPELIGENR